MSADPIRDIREWFTAQWLAHRAAQQAARKALSGEWYIAADSVPTSQDAKVQVSMLIGSIRLEWARERRERR